MNEFDPPRVIIRFHTDVEVPDDPAVVLEKSDPPRWRRLIEESGAVALRPVFTALDPRQLRDLQEQAARRDPSYRPAPLDRFFYVDVPETRDLESVAGMLRQWATVRSVVALPFVVAGAPDEAREFAVELISRLPGDAEVLLELPLRFARDFKADLRIVRVDERRDLAVARLAPGGRVRFGPALIGAGAVSRLRLLVRLADPGQRGGSSPASCPARTRSAGSAGSSRPAYAPGRSSPGRVTRSAHWVDRQDAGLTGSTPG